MVITGSEFIGNTAGAFGNNIHNIFGDVTCDDGTNTFESPAAGGYLDYNDSQGNSPAGLCASTTR
jgi:hypothetical protein